MWKSEGQYPYLLGGAHPSCPVVSWVYSTPVILSSLSSFKNCAKIKPVGCSLGESQSFRHLCSWLACRSMEAVFCFFKSRVSKIFLLLSLLPLWWWLVSEGQVPLGMADIFCHCIDQKGRRDIRWPLSEGKNRKIDNQKGLEKRRNKKLTTVKGRKKSNSNFLKLIFEKG